MSRRKLPVKQNSLGGRIEQALAVRSISRVQLAAATNFKTSYLSQVIRGLKEPSDKFYSLVAQALNVSEHWLKVGEGPMEAERSQELSCEALYSAYLVSVPAEDAVEYWAKGSNKEIVELLKHAAEILTGEDSGTAHALRENILSSYEKITKIKNLERRIEALEKALDRHDPPGEAKET